MNQFKCMKCSRIAGQPPVQCNQCGKQAEWVTVTMDNDPVKNTYEWRCKHGCGRVSDAVPLYCCGTSMKIIVDQNT